jgi:MFS family permease
MGSPNLRLGSAVSFVNTATTSSSAVLLTLYLQQHHGTMPLQAGLQLLPLNVAVIFGSAAAKSLSARFSRPRLAASGLFAIASGNLVLVLLSRHVAGVTAGVLLIGVGLGVASVAATAIGTDVPEAIAGTASGVVNTAAQLGTALGIAVFLAVAAAGTPEQTGTKTAWVIIAATAGSAAGGCALPRINPPCRESSGSPGCRSRRSPSWPRTSTPPGTS